MVVAIVVLRGQIQIFKQTEHTYQHIRAEKKAEYHCLPVLPFLTINLLFSISVMLAQLHYHPLCMSLAFAWLVQNLKTIP